MGRKLDDAVFWIAVGFLIAMLAGCKSPTAPDPVPLMILNPDLQGIA